MTPNTNEFEAFLASMMTYSNGSGVRKNGHADEFWQVTTLRYYGCRLQQLGCDVDFDVACSFTPGTRRYRFALTMWPDFEFGVMTSPDGFAFHPHFIRADRNLLLPARLTSLHPWSATVEEVLQSFGTPINDDMWDHRRWTQYRVAEATWTLIFDFGLIQGVFEEERSDGTTVE